MKIGDLELSENLFCVDIQGCGRTLFRTHFDYFNELCVDLVQFVRWYEGGKFFVAGGECGMMDYQFLIFGRVVWVELISEYDNIMLKL